MCLLSLITAMAAAPKPAARLQLAPQGLDAFASTARPAPFGDAAEIASAEVWGRGRLRWQHLRMLLGASAPAPGAHVATQALGRFKAGEGCWRLKTSARVSRHPQERRVRLGLRQSSSRLQLSGGLEALDAELSPAPGFRKRLVRRLGPSVGMRWRPFGARAQARANSLAASARLWPLSPAGPVWDLSAAVTSGWQGQAAWQPTLWGQASARSLTGSSDALLQGGDFLPSDTLQIGAPSSSSRLLRTHIRGFEDATWYATQQANLSLGLCAQPRPWVQLEVFGAAGVYANKTCAEPGRADVVRHASGAAMQVRSRIAGRPVLVRYQVALRHQGSRQPVLHMVTASL